MKKIITLIVITLFTIMNTKKSQAQISIDDINVELRGMYKNLKRAPDSIPFLFDMASHVVDEKFFKSYNDSDLISKGLFLSIYEEMKNAAYDTTLLQPTNSIEARMRRRSTNDTINISIFNADYATFLDEAFDVDGQYYYLTDTTVADVPNRSLEPFLLKNVFVSTLTRSSNYFRNVHFRIDSSFVFSNAKLLRLNADDLNPQYARWNIDFGDGKGWVSFNPFESRSFMIEYPDSGLYEIKLAVFNCDPYPQCNTYESKLTKTSIYIVNNTTSVEPNITYNFTNVTVGLYKGCGEMKGGVYIPQKPLIIVEGIDLLNIRNIPILYDDNIKITSSKKLGLLSEYNYDFYVVNFNNTHLDMRENAKGIVELIEYLKSIMNTNEQFVVFAESMGGIITRYALTYMETDAYVRNPSSIKPTQMHNTRLYISNDAPHQGANLPLSIQAFYRNLQSSTAFKVMKSSKHLLPIMNEEKFWNDMLSSPSVQQLLAYHIDASGPHQNRIDFMADLIAMNPQTNGYPAYCKMMALSDGLLSGQPQLTIKGSILNPGESMFTVDLKIITYIRRKVKVKLLDYNLNLNAVNKDLPSHKIVVAKNTHAYLNFKKCLRKFIRYGINGVIHCAVKYEDSEQSILQPYISSNYDTEAGGIFPVLSLLATENQSNYMYVPPFDLSSTINLTTGEVKLTAITNRFLPDPNNLWNIQLKLKVASHGFAFIPVHSAIDFDYTKSQNISSDYNLLQHNVQDFLFAYSPFHVIAGFNYETDDYPTNVKVEDNNMNWSHGYFANTLIDDGSGDAFMCREIGDYIIYLNNLNVDKRNVDFKFKEVYYGYQNPNYNYATQAFNTKKVKYVYSKANYFQFREPSIVNIFYASKSEMGTDIDVGGRLNIKKMAIEPCTVTHKKKIEWKELYNVETTVTPNPINEYIYINNLQKDAKYYIVIHNVLGQKVYEKEFNNMSMNSYQINTSELEINQIYFITVYSNSNISIRTKLLKQ
jgi:hypothetical protein